MYIVAIAWLYVTLLVSVMQPTVFRGIVTFAAVGLAPLMLLLYLMGTPQRRRNRDRAQAAAADAPPRDCAADPSGTVTGSSEGDTVNGVARSR